MDSRSRLLITPLSAGILGLIIGMASTSLYAAPPRNDDRLHEKVDRRRGHEPPVVIHRGSARPYRADRTRRYRNVIIARPHGHWYHGYGRFGADDDAYKWLSFTAITLKILDNLNEEQQREHETAQIKATDIGVGETIVWNKKGASGSVTVLRDGTSTTGRYCREFQQEVTIGGKREQAYGTACRNPDGSWEMVSTGSP